MSSVALESLRKILMIQLRYLNSSWDFKFIAESLQKQLGVCNLNVVGIYKAGRVQPKMLLRCIIGFYVI